MTPVELGLEDGWGATVAIDCKSQVPDADAHAGRVANAVARVDYQAILLGAGPCFLHLRRNKVIFYLHLSLDLRAGDFDFLQG